MGQEEGLKALDNIVTQFNTYEDFLDSQITTVDLYYLEVRAERGRVAAAPRPSVPPPVPASWASRPLALDSSAVRLRRFGTATLKPLAK